MNDGMKMFLAAGEAIIAMERDPDKYGPLHSAVQKFIAKTGVGWSELRLYQARDVRKAVTDQDADDFPSLWFDDWTEIIKLPEADRRPFAERAVIEGLHHLAVREAVNAILNSYKLEDRDQSQMVYRQGGKARPGNPMPDVNQLFQAMKARPKLVEKMEEFNALIASVKPSKDKVNSDEFSKLHAAEVWLHGLFARHGISLGDPRLVNSLQMAIATLFLAGRDGKRTR